MTVVVAIVAIQKIAVTCMFDEMSMLVKHKTSKNPQVEISILQIFATTYISMLLLFIICLTEPVELVQFLLIVETTSNFEA
jgi:hypothetical protein